MGAMGLQTAEGARLGAKDDQVLTKNSNLAGQIPQLLGHRDRLPKGPHQLAHRCSGPDMAEVDILARLRNTVGRFHTESPLPTPGFPCGIR